MLPLLRKVVLISIVLAVPSSALTVRDGDGYGPKRLQDNPAFVALPKFDTQQEREPVSQTTPQATLDADFLTTTVPTYGIENVTELTLPPVQRVDPWLDMQPVDTAIGTFLTEGFAERPTVTPLPSQSSVDAVRAGCPMLLNWPQQLDIYALNPCEKHGQGAWRDSSTNEHIMRFGQSCNPFGGGLAPLVTYSSVLGEETFAFTQKRVTLFESQVVLNDCAGNLRYTIEEKVYKQRARADSLACARFGACDGTDWFQYFLRQANGTLAAQTPWIHLFQSELEFVHPITGATIATAQRIGEWIPNQDNCQGDRRWQLSYADPFPHGPLAIVTERWPLAALMTVATMRDANRRSSGSVAPSWCEVWKASTLILGLWLAASFTTIAALFFLRDAVPPLTAALFEWELKVCGRRMALPSKYVH